MPRTSLKALGELFIALEDYIAQLTEQRNALRQQIVDRASEFSGTLQVRRFHAQIVVQDSDYEIVHWKQVFDSLRKTPSLLRAVKQHTEIQSRTNVRITRSKP